MKTLLSSLAAIFLMCSAGSTWAGGRTYSWEKFIQAKPVMPNQPKIFYLPKGVKEVTFRASKLKVDLNMLKPIKKPTVPGVVIGGILPVWLDVETKAGKKGVLFKVQEGTYYDEVSKEKFSVKPRPRGLRE